jgi:hypothetical protein
MFILEWIAYSISLSQCLLIAWKEQVPHQTGRIPYIRAMWPVHLLSGALQKLDWIY